MMNIYLCRCDGNLEASELFQGRPEPLTESELNSGPCEREGSEEGEGGEEGGKVFIANPQAHQGEGGEGGESAEEGAGEGGGEGGAAEEGEALNWQRGRQQLPGEGSWLNQFFVKQ